MHKYKTVIQVICAALASLMVLVVVAYGYTHKLRDNLETDLKANLSEISHSTTTTIKVHIQDNLKMLQNIAAILDNSYANDKYDLIEKLKAMNNNDLFMRMGIADVNGDCITNNDEAFNIADRTYFKSAWNGEPAFSDTIKDKVEGINLNVFAVPIYHDGVVRNVLFASSYTNSLASDLLVTIFEDKGFTSIGDREGNIVLNSTNQASMGLHNLDEMKLSDDFQLKNLKENEEGILLYEDASQKEHYLAYEPLGINNWYVFSIVPVSVVSVQINEFVRLAMITWGIIALIFSGIILWMGLSRLRNNLKMDNVIFYDSLTNHYNYNKFRLKAQTIMDAKEGNQYVMGEFDISEFKLFNELYGYQHGDKILKSVMCICDELCGSYEYCARISADRFILLWKLQEKDEIIERYEQLVENIKHQMTSHYEQFKASIYIGFYRIQKGDSDFSKCHDRSMYAKDYAKKMKKNKYAFFTESMYDRLLFDKKLESHMEEALENHEFQVYLQPKIRLCDDVLSGAEALVRWHSPTLGMIGPNQFIPLFEANGFLEQLDLYMMDQVFQIMKGWQEKGKEQIRISINVSRIYIFKPGFATRVYEKTKEYGLDPSFVEIEITESVIFDRGTELKDIIIELQSYGFLIAMDDFGSGYSSLNMLKDIPINVMKLDQVFFQTSYSNTARGNMIVEGMIQMAKALRIETIAEGIENADEVAFLRRAGCDEIQGYYYSKPLPVKEFEKYWEHK